MFKGIGIGDRGHVPPSFQKWGQSVFDAFDFHVGLKPWCIVIGLLVVFRIYVALGIQAFYSTLMKK